MAAAAFGAALLLAAGSAAPLSAGSLNLNYSIFFPPGHGQCREAMQWADEVQKNSSGKISITLFPGGTLTTAAQCYDGVVKGISDIGMSCFAYTRGRFPTMEALDLPLGYASGIVATRVANAFYRKIRPPELDDVKVLLLHAHGPGLLHSRKPVRCLEDVSAMKIRSTGLSAKLVQSLGGVPVAMPQGSTYEALQKGVVEGTFGPIEVLKGWKQAEVLPYTTGCHRIGYTTVMFVVMNRAKWQALPSELQKVIEDASERWITHHGQRWDLLDEQGRAYTLGLGNQIISLPASESKRWQVAVQAVIEDYIAAKSNDGLPARAFLETIEELLSDEAKHLAAAH
jgi:TRAP-type C4-dicarboxylate transport system substrate-binding protein